MRFDTVIAINPPNPPDYVSNKDSMGGFGQLFPIGATLFPPLDLVYFASYLADRGGVVEVIECLGSEIDQAELLRRLEARSRASKGRALLVARTSAPTLDWDLSVCAEIKEKIAHLEIAIYGPVVLHVIPRIQRETCIDFIIPGDPEQVVDELREGLPPEGIRGLTYRDSDGQWQRNPDRELVKELDSLPFPKWEMFPYQKYKLPKSSTKSESLFLPMLTSRGCPIGCHYCPYPVGQGLAWRFRSATNVVDEIEHLVRDLKVRYILFRDPILSLNQKRVVQICEEIVRRGIDVEWRCETRIDCLSEETLKAMAGAGCTGINFGIESADVQIQAGVGRKPIAQEVFVRTISQCRVLGIKTFSFFIIGLPGDTLETVLKTIKFAIDLQPNWVQFTAASPFIGTKLREWAISKGFAEEDEYAYISSHEAMMGNENLSKVQVQALLHFAKFVGNYMINRKGVLKDDGRPGRLYRAAKTVADSASGGAAQVAYALGRRHFERRFRMPT